MKRQTVQRTAIEQVMRHSGGPMSIEDILIYGRKIVPSLNQATVYRNLKFLIDAGRIRQIIHPMLGALYEETEKGHHHHFHCHQCNRVFELPGCVLKQDSVVPKGFIVESHDIFLYGLCPCCAQEV